MHTGVQQHRQAQLVHIRGEPLVRGGQAEETREAQASRCRGRPLPARGGTLPSARRCRRPPAMPGRPSARSCACAGQSVRASSRWAARSAASCRIASVICARRRFRGAACAARTSAQRIGDLGLVLREQRLFPEQPDRQHVGGRRVRAVRQFRLPQPVAGDLRPAAQAQQQLVEVGLARRPASSPSASQARASAAGASSGAVGDIGGETLQARDFRRQIVAGEGPPARSARRVRGVSCHSA